MSDPAISDSNGAGEYWIFGYGSLIWKPPPHYDLRVPGYITGYVRRFWQASQDHRGTPTSPGRVVTLISRSYWKTLGEEPSSSSPSTTTPDRVYGAAYRIPPPHVKQVQEYLDIREINGYSIQYTTFFPSPSPTSPSPPPSSPSPSTPTSPSPPHPHPPTPNCLLYIGLPSNPQFLGLQSPDDIASVIASSAGPSGANEEYLFMLEEALGELGKWDEHVMELAGKVRVLLKEKKEKEKNGSGEGEEADDGKGEVAGRAVEVEIEKVGYGGGGGADEETEKVV